MGKRFKKMLCAASTAAFETLPSSRVKTVPITGPSLVSRILQLARVGQQLREYHVRLCRGLASILSFVHLPKFKVRSRLAHSRYSSSRWSCPFLSSDRDSQADTNHLLSLFKLIVFITDCTRHSLERLVALVVEFPMCP